MARSPSLAFTGVVLAGGRSRRFGDRNKALAVYDGATFVERAVDAVADAAGESPVVAVATGDQRATVAEALSPERNPEFALDAPDFEGPVSGLYGALPAVETDWLFVTACDMPRLSASAIRWLAARVRDREAVSDAPASERGDLSTSERGDLFTTDRPDAVVPERADGHREPLHGFYRREAVADPRVRDRLEPASGLRALLDALPATRTVRIPASPPDVALAASVGNVNTRAEYRRLRRSPSVAGSGER